jgi:nicotinamidase-related amidase
MELAELVDPTHTAIVTQEVQKGVVGPESTLPLLAEAARATGALDNMGRLVDAGRAVGVEVITALPVIAPT